MELVFVTGNVNKAREVNAVLGHSVVVKSLKDLGFDEEIPETQDTLAGNALQKARYIHDRFGVNCFADDTGLCVQALDGRPGVYSARYAGEQCNAEDNMTKLLAELEGQENRTAYFSTVIALILNGTEYLFEGRAEGAITTKRSGSQGFGYDPIFQPNGYDVTFAEMTLDEKNKISHRARATRNLADFLASL